MMVTILGLLLSFSVSAQGLSNNLWHVPWQSLSVEKHKELTTSQIWFDNNKDIAELVRVLQSNCETLGEGKGRFPSRNHATDQPDLVFIGYGSDEQASFVRTYALARHFDLGLFPAHNSCNSNVVFWVDRPYQWDELQLKRFNPNERYFCVYKANELALKAVKPLRCLNDIQIRHASLGAANAKTVFKNFVLGN